MAMVFLSLSNMYQHSTLEEIRDIIESNVKKVPAEEMQERLIQFIDHIQREDHIDDEAHQNSLHSLEKEFHNANEGPKQNKYLSVRPRTFYEYIGKPYLWGNVTDKIDTITSDVLEKQNNFVPVSKQTSNSFSAMCSITGIYKIKMANDNR